MLRRRTHSTAVVFSPTFYLLTLNLRLTVEIRADASEVGHHCFAIGSHFGLGGNNSSGVGVVLYSTSLIHARSLCAGDLSTTSGDLPRCEFFRLSPYSAETKTSSFADRDSINPTQHCRSCRCFGRDLTTKPPGTSTTPTTNHHLTSWCARLRPIDS